MKNILKYNLLFFGLAILASGCKEEDTLLQEPVQDDGYIRIVSGRVGSSSRAIDDEPTYSGQCNADKLIVYQYRRHSTGYVVSNPATPSEMNLNEMYETDLEHFSDQENYPYFQNDKWARQKAELRFYANQTTAFAFPALAYSKEDKERFTVNTAVDLENMTLSINGDITPELYFGRLDADGLTPENATGIYKDYDKKTGIYSEYVMISDDYRTKSLTGKLYRIVSQINVTISNVNPDLIEKMTMELSNLPTEIGLFANHRTEPGGTGNDHGFLYPIVAAKNSQQKNEKVVVCETSDFRKGIANLSTFLLPSETGRSLYIHIYFKEDSNMEELDKSYEVRPPKSYYIPSDAAEAYFSKNPLCVYNVTDNLFFSYSNVRVNITGDFENFFPERTEVNMDVEVCSRFDNEHNYGGLIDYN